MIPAVIVFARAPRAGQAKTRLIPALGADGAASFYRCLLLDRCDQMRALDDVAAIVAFTPDDAHSELAELLPSIPLWAQGDGDLTARLVRATNRAFAEGYGPVLVMDSDSPTLPPSFVADAIAALQAGERDAMIVPATDGGYVLLGLNQPSPAVFEAIPWSSDQVLATTLARAEAAGLSVGLMPAWRDIDEPEDVDWLRDNLHKRAWPVRTAEWLRTPLARIDVTPPPDIVEAPWVQEQSRYTYGNAWLKVREDVARLPDGAATVYGVVESHDAVGVLPLLPNGDVVLVRQYRYIAGRPRWEIPTGGVHPGEDLVAAAQRELGEEAGYEAGALEKILSFDTNKALMAERCHLYRGTALRPVPTQRDQTEFMEVGSFPLDEALAKVYAGEISAAMTVVALLHAARNMA